MSSVQDWRTVRLSEIVDKQRPITYGIVQAGPHVEGGIPYIRVSDMTLGRLSVNGMLRTSQEIAQTYRRSRVKTDDLVFALRGTPGLTLKVTPELEGANLTQGTARIAPSNEVDAEFLLQAIHSGPVQRDIMQRIKGSTFQEITLEELGKVIVLLPPLAEQRKIAAILSTWDGAITLAEQLIDTLKRRKQALMQLLLTGRVRFPEFTGEEWEMSKLEDVFERVQRPITGIPDNVLSITATVGFVDQGGKFGRVIAGKNLERYIHLKRGEFAYNKGNSKSYPQGCIYRLSEYENGAIPNVYYAFRAIPTEVNADFYKHYFESGILNDQLRLRINSGVRNDGLLNISADAFFGMEISVPPIPEQIKIAALLDDVTTEITSRKQQLQVYQEQKRGLMQQLLTGNVRVKTDHLAANNEV